MKRWEPPYYAKFSCLKDRCSHSCCTGWEIDIDEETSAVYDRIPGEWGKTVRERIVRENGTVHFLLDREGRCPFLTRKGLCRIILHDGEGMLCRICREHPRFYHVFADHMEAGLGLCCEEAARLCLTWPSPAAWIVTGEGEEEEDPQEAALLSFREECIRIIQNRNLPVSRRVRTLKSRYAVRTPGRKEAAAFFRSLERMDEEWTRVLDSLGNGEGDNENLPLPEAELALEQWMVYLLCRHLPDAAEDGNVQGHLGLCVMIWEMTQTLFAQVKHTTGTCWLSEMTEIVRLFSSEIEYSQENTDAVVRYCTHRE